MQPSKVQKLLLLIAMTLIAAAGFVAYLQPSLILNLAQNLSLC
ncbi:hypothetical protein [Undibacterium sp.]|jgi:hypothetical protein|nr:hypothetical protein [Undibacterium sp.]HTD06329.1 hypothetical protein [Undibacterium sp.]